MGRVFGIDLGTTNSCISYYAKGTHSSQAVIIPLAGGNNTLPSCVWYKDGIEGEVVVGQEAYQRRWDIEHVVYSVKRLMGSDAKISLKDASGKEFVVTPVQVSYQILRALKMQAEVLYGKVEDVVITVPAYFNVRQRMDTKKAAELAGMKVLSLISEPTSAALAYGLKSEQESDVILVYDLGGGTFDASLLKYEKIQKDALAWLNLDEEDSTNNDESVYQVISTSGNNHLGGDDLDKGTADIIIKGVKQKCEAEYGEFTDIRVDPQEYERLVLNIEQRKKISGNNIHSYTLKYVVYNEKTGAEFEESNEVFWSTETVNQALVGVFKRTLSCIQECLRTARNPHFNRIVLVGGSTKYEPLKQLIARTYPDVEILDSLNPDESVALGAAIKASIDKYSEGISVDDILPASLGVEVVNTLNDIHLSGRFTPIILKNSVLPVEAVKPFTTHVDNQEVIQVNVYQGSSSLVAENTYIGSLEFDGIPKGPAGEVEVMVKFSIDVNGILTVTMITSKWKKQVELKNILNPDTDNTTEAEKLDPMLKRLLVRMQAMMDAITDEKLRAEAQSFVDKIYREGCEDEEQITQMQRILAQLQKAYKPISYAAETSAFTRLNSGIGFKDSSADIADFDEDEEEA